MTYISNLGLDWPANAHLKEPDMKHLHKHLLRMTALLVGMACSMAGMAQQRTVHGRVTDAESKEALPFVHVVVPGTQRGVVTDIEGRFRIPCPDTLSALEFSMMGYNTKRQPLGKSDNLKVTLQPSAKNLKTVTVKAKRTKKRYRRKENPAVELMQQVVAHKEQNHVEALPYYARHRYSKTSFAFDDFHPNFKRHLFWKHLPFVEKYIDVTPFDNTEILNISLSEQLMEQRHGKGVTRTLVTARRSDGLAGVGESEGLGELDIFGIADIYQNDIEMMENHFVSPLHSTQANSTYHYYITDTVELDGEMCVELSFSPVNRADYAFVGRMYIVMDSSYAVKRYEMAVAPYANINFVKSINMMQNYVRDPQGHLVPQRGDTYGRLSLTPRIKLLKSIYVHLTDFCYDYQSDSVATAVPDSARLRTDSLFRALDSVSTVKIDSLDRLYADSIAPFPDSLFNRYSLVAMTPGANKVKRAVWNKLRPIHLNEPELLVDSFRFELMRTPFMRHTIHAAMILGTGYIPTSKDRDSSKFDIGPIYNFYSINNIEGRRFRIGGMTKAQLNNQNFASGYVAYGMDDRRMKFGTTLTHTFEPKQRHAGKSPDNRIFLDLGYDLKSPGLAFELFAQDNILSSTTTRLMEYVGSVDLGYQHRWKTSLLMTTNLVAESHEPVGDLSYRRLTAGGDTAMVGRYNTFEWNTHLNFVPNRKSNDARGNMAVFGDLRNSTSVTLDHTMGVFEGFYYNRTVLNARKVLWLTPLGYMDLRLEAGKMWNQAPLPKLFFPLGNASQYMAHGAFNAMRPMEFASDQYVALYANYHMRGFIFNHLPIIRRFKLREVASFNMYWGSLSARNNPANGQAGLYLLPAHTQQLGTLPYMEYSIGIENIAHVIRIDYVKRITYTDGPSIDGWRIGFELSL